MANSNLKVGDVVVLKSGGPDMTVREIITKTTSLFGEATSELTVNEVKVQWFLNNELKSGTFTEPQLENPDNDGE